MKLCQPDPLQIQRVKAILDSLNYPVHKDVIISICAASNYWMTSTDEGRESLAKMLGLATADGKDDQEYYVRGEQIASKSVKMIYGYIAKGTPVHPDEMEVHRKIPEQCELCNGMVMCAQYIKEPVELYACSSCVGSDPDLKMKHKFQNCSECNYTKCTHNPNRRKG